MTEEEKKAAALAKRVQELNRARFAKLREEYAADFEMISRYLRGSQDATVSGDAGSLAAFRETSFKSRVENAWRRIDRFQTQARGWASENEKIAKAERAAAEEAERAALSQKAAAIAEKEARRAEYERLRALRKEFGEKID